MCHIPPVWSGSNIFLMPQLLALILHRDIVHVTIFLMRAIWTFRYMNHNCKDTILSSLTGDTTQKPCHISLKVLEKCKQNTLTTNSS